MTYALARSLCAPTSPKEKPFADIVALLGEHYAKAKQSVIVQRCKFHTRMRQPGESVATFVAHLRGVAQYCDFKEVLDDMLRDRLVCGINDSRIQQRLLAEPELSFKKAYDLAISAEVAGRDVRVLQQPTESSVATQQLLVEQESSVHVIDKLKPGKPCYHCGRPHLEKNCRFRDATCFECKKVGHINC